MDRSIVGTLDLVRELVALVSWTEVHFCTIEWVNFLCALASFPGHCFRLGNRLVYIFHQEYIYTVIKASMHMASKQLYEQYSYIIHGVVRPYHCLPSQVQQVAPCQRLLSLS